MTVVAAISTVRGIPSEVELNSSDGMPASYVLSFDNVATIRKDRLVGRITKLSPARMEQVCRAWRVAGGC